MSNEDSVAVDENPSEKIIDWITDLVGPVSVISKFGHLHASSQLWRVESGGEMLWLKMHAHERKWAGEVHALTQWAPAMGRTPKILGFRKDPYAILLSEVPGKDAEQVDLNPEAELRMWGQAGEWLARLHQITNEWLGEVQWEGTPSGPTISNPITMVYSGVERRLAEAAPLNLFDARERDFIHSAMWDWLPALENEKAVAIHRDFTPRNWLVDGDGNLTGVIDFEHARWDVRAADLNRPPDHEFLVNPCLKDAFFEAYGWPSEQLETQILALRLSQIVAAIVWGVLVGEIDYSKRNRVALLRMMNDRAKL